MQTFNYDDNNVAISTPQNNLSSDALTAVQTDVLASCKDMDA